MDRQIFQLTDRALALTDVLPSQDAAGAIEAGKSTFQDIKDLIGPKCYKAFIAQTGTAAPTMTVINNDLSAAIVWTRSSAGVYVGTLAGAFLAAKTFFPSMHQSLPIVDRSIYIFRIDDDSISIQSRAISTTALADLGQVDLFGIEVNVYN